MTPIATAAALSGAATTIISCTSTQNEKILPTNLFSIEETTLKGLKDSADISQYDTIVIPSSIRIVDTDAFNNSKIDYSNIKTLRFSNGIKLIRKNAFAGLKNLELIDYSNFDIDTITGLTVEQGAFGKTLPTYCYVKLPTNIPSSSLLAFKNKLLTCGIPESWFVEKTEGHAEMTSEEKNVKYDGIDPTKIETKLNKPIGSNEKFEVSVSKTSGTDKVGIKLSGQPQYANQTLTYQVELEPETGKTLADGDYVEYKVTILNKTTSETSNSETTNWVQVINSCKITYKTPELYVTDITVSSTHPERIYHQGDAINKDEVLVQTIYNDRSKETLLYGEDGYSVEGIDDFETGHIITEEEARNKTLSLKFKYSKKGVGEFSHTFTFNNIALKVESINIQGSQTITRGTNSQYSTQFLPSGSETTVNWSIEPTVIGQSIEGVTIDNKGIVTVANQSETNPINIIATDASDKSIVGKLTNVKIEIPAVEGIRFKQAPTTCFRGSQQQEYKFVAESTNPAAKQEFTYSIKETQPTAVDEKVSIDATTGVVTIGKNVAYNTNITIVATAKDGSGVTGTTTFTVDIPNPTKIEISHDGASSMQRVQETKTFTATVYPDGAEQSVNWFATSSTGSTISGLTITGGVLNASNSVAPQTVKVYATHNPQSKTTTSSCTSNTKEIDITYAEITSLQITGGPFDPLDPTSAKIARGAKATTPLTATLTDGAYTGDIRWSIDEAVTGDGTSIDSKGYLTLGKQVRYNNKSYFTVRAKAYDENGVLKQEASKAVYYSIPSITNATFVATRTPSAVVTMDDNTHDPGASFTYSVSISPNTADTDLIFEFDKGTSTVTKEDETLTTCTINASKDITIGGQYTIKATTVGTNSSGQPYTFNKNISIVLPKFSNATWEYTNSVAKTFENSDQDTTAAKAVCDSFSDSDLYVESGTTAKECLANLVGKYKYVNTTKINVIDVCTDTLTSDTSKKALFTFELDSPVGKVQFDSNKKPLSGSNLETYMKGLSFYTTLENYIKSVRKSDSDGTTRSFTTFIASQYEAQGGYSLYKTLGLKKWADKAGDQWTFVWTRTDNNYGASIWAYRPYNSNVNWESRFKATEPCKAFPMFCI